MLSRSPSPVRAVYTRRSDMSKRRPVWDEGGQRRPTDTGQDALFPLTDACRDEWLALPRARGEEDEDADSRITYSDNECADVSDAEERETGGRSEGRRCTMEEAEGAADEGESESDWRDGEADSEESEADEAGEAGEGDGLVEQDARAHFAAAMRGTRAVRQRSSRRARRPSTMGSMHREQRELFPVRGVSCVGCLLGSRMGVVDKYVRANSMRLGPNLFRMAAYVYKCEVAKPAIAHGCTAPPFPWKKLREHYMWHVLDRRLQLQAHVRSLGLLTGHAKQELARATPQEEEDDNGESALRPPSVRLELDPKRVDVYLKLLSAHERHLSSLHAMESGGASSVSTGGGGGSWSKE